MASNVALISRAASVGLGVLLVVCCLISTALAQYRFDSLTADTGLPQNIIRAVHQTRDGYLWVATLDGLARFDGVRFTVFDKSNTPGIHSNRFYSRLHDDRQGDLWLGTENGYVTRYSRGRFTTYTTAHGLPPTAVSGFTEDEEGKLYCLSGQRLWRWQPTPGSERTEGRFNEVATPPLLGGLYPVDWTGRGFWGVDHAGLHRFVGGRWEFHPLPVAFRQPNLTVAEEPNGMLWVATPDGRVAHLKDGRMVKLSRAPSGRPGDREPLWQVNWPGGQGKSWTLGVDRGLFLSLTLPSSGRLERVLSISFLKTGKAISGWGPTARDCTACASRRSPSTRSSRVWRRATSIRFIEDRAGAVWIGRWDGGLSRFKDGKFTNFTARDGLPTDRVTALTKTAPGACGSALPRRPAVRSGTDDSPPLERADHFQRHRRERRSMRIGRARSGSAPRGLVRYRDGAVTIYGERTAWPAMT